jgi:hypothetical protein
VWKNAALWRVVGLAVLEILDKSIGYHRHFCGEAVRSETDDRLSSESRVRGRLTSGKLPRMNTDEILAAVQSELQCHMWDLFVDEFPA